VLALAPEDDNVEAARSVHRVHPEVCFQLLGALDTNPSAVPKG
jgi:hypothetical protein